MIVDNPSQSQTADQITRVQLTSSPRSSQEKKINYKTTVESNRQIAFAGQAQPYSGTLPPSNRLTATNNIP